MLDFTLLNDYRPKTKSPLQLGLQMVESIARKHLPSKELDIAADLLECGLNPREVAEEMGYVRTRKPNRKRSTPTYRRNADRVRRSATLH